MKSLGWVNTKGKLSQGAQVFLKYLSTKGYIMKKLLILAFLASAATANATTPVAAGVGALELISVPAKIVTAPFRAIKKAVKAVERSAKSVGSEIKDIGIELKNEISDTANQATQKVTNSELWQEATDIAAQFAAAPSDIGQDIKDGYYRAVDATKTLGNKISDSRFAGHVRNANSTIIEHAKKTTTTAKDFAHDAANSEIVEDLKDVGQQFASASKDAWFTTAAFFTAFKSEFID